VLAAGVDRQWIEMGSMLRKAKIGRTSGSEGSHASTVLERVREGLVLLDDAVVELADADELLGLAGLVAERLGLEPEDVFRAVAAPSEQLLTVLCRAAGLNVNGFSAVLRMRCRTRGAMHSPALALTAFHEMPVDAAKRMVPLAKAR
jgi:hypothetical protein